MQGKSISLRLETAVRVMAFFGVPFPVDRAIVVAR